jgi:hypothetical protein
MKKVAIWMKMVHQVNMDVNRSGKLLGVRSSLVKLEKLRKLRRKEESVLQRGKKR